MLLMMTSFVIFLAFSREKKISKSEDKDLDDAVDDHGDENLMIFPAFTRRSDKKKDRMKGIPSWESI